MLPYPQPVLNYPPQNQYYTQQPNQGGLYSRVSTGQHLSPSRLTNNSFHQKPIMNALPVASLQNRGPIPHQLPLPQQQQQQQPPTPQGGLNQQQLNHPSQNSGSGVTPNVQSSNTQNPVVRNRNSNSNVPPLPLNKSGSDSQVVTTHALAAPTVYVPTAIDEQSLNKIIDFENQKAKKHGMSPPQVERYSSPAGSNPLHQVINPQQLQNSQVPNNTNQLFSPKPSFFPSSTGVPGIFGSPHIGYNYSSPQKGNNAKGLGVGVGYSSPFNNQNIIQNQQLSGAPPTLNQPPNRNFINNQPPQQPTKPAVNYEQLYNFEKKRANQSQETIDKLEKLDKSQKEIIEQYKQRIKELQDKNNSLENQVKGYQDYFIEQQRIQQEMEHQHEQELLHQQQQNQLLHNQNPDDFDQQDYDNQNFDEGGENQYNNQEQNQDFQNQDQNQNPNSQFEAKNTD